jgi:eukaryotic-like serine/threonine-protein kinase
VNVRRRKRPGRLNRDSPALRIGLRLVGIAIAAFVVGYAFATVVFFRDGAREQFVAVPDLRGMQEARARSVANDLGLEFEVANALPHPETAAGALLAQTPLPGQEVRPGTAVRVIVSAGRERARVPDVAHLGTEQARNLLERMGFTVRTTEVPHASTAGRLVELRPAPGTQVLLPTELEMVVSSGPPLAEVPQLAGRTADDAEEILMAAGFRLGGVNFDPFGPGVHGRIHAQRPAPGDSARTGATVDVWISGVPEEGLIREPY